MGEAVRVGKVLAGKYQIDAPVDRDGRGLVFAATHRLTQEPIVVEFVAAERLGDEPAKRRFVQETQTVASLRHPNVVRLIDVDDDKDLGLYTVVESLRGESLEAWLARDSRISLRELCEILLPVMHALSEAHSRDVHHGALGPAKIVLHEDRDGRRAPKLLGFGFARSAGGARTDVESMAALVEECLAGKAQPDRTAHAAVEAAIARARSAESGQRAPSMRQLMLELAAAAEIDPVAVLAPHGLRWSAPSDRPEPAVQTESLTPAELAALPQVLDPAQLPPPPNFQRITTGLAIALFLIAALLVGSSFRRAAPPALQGAGGAAAPTSGIEDEEPLPGIMPTTETVAPPSR